MAGENQDTPRGLFPINSPQGSVKRCGKYTILAGSTKIFLNDPVIKESGGGITIASAGATNPLCGSVMSIFDPNGVPVSYYPAGSLTGYTAIVADDPMQEFWIQEDSVGGDLALTDVNATCNLVAGAGNEVTGYSGWMLDSSELGTDATDQLLIVKKLDEVTNLIGDYCKWVVRINLHQNNLPSAGV